MDIASQITRIQTDRDTLRTKAKALKLATKGTEDSPTVAITDSSNLDEIASAFDAIKDNGGVQATVKEGETYHIAPGYHDGTGTVSGVSGGGNYTLQTKAVTPSKAKQQVTPDDGYYGLSSVTVNEIPAEYQNVSSVTATEDTVLANTVFVDKTGAQKTGNIPVNGELNKSMDGLTSTEVIIPAGHTTGGKVVLTDAIEKALAAI